MILVFVGLMVFDGWLDGSLRISSADKPIQGTILSIFVAVLIIPAQWELGKLAGANGLKVFVPLTTVSSILLATGWYWCQVLSIAPAACLVSVLVLSVLAIFLYQYAGCGTRGVFANCGANCLVLCYAGLLSSFCVGIRVEFGVWPLLMFVFAVKSSDIGAYAVGTAMGRHKLAPVVSPKKTWEGLAGGMAASAIVALLFGVVCDIMIWPLAVVFGLASAVIGQLGDLAESMLKRDAEQKDSSARVPGFGGVLDIVDSPLVVAPFAYLFFRIVVGR
jgi:phosphatidate cytidylyltransferase